MLAQLKQEFPDDLRVVYRHFPLPQHDKAHLAAVASEAAGQQGKFWEMHDLLFINLPLWFQMSPADFREQLGEYAAELELDVDKFQAGLDDPALTALVDDAYDTAINIPLPGTPVLLFNGEPLAEAGMLAHWPLSTLIKLEVLKERQFAAPPPDIIDPFKLYHATLVTDKGDIVIELFAEQAPLTVNNFVFLAQEGWYDGVTFHRVIAGFAAQSGDPSGTGYGGPGYLIPDEITPAMVFDAAGWLGMANGGPNTNGSQFFISLAALPDLDGRYTRFGRVITGMDVLAELTPRDPNADAYAPPGDVIHTIRVEEQ